MNREQRRALRRAGFVLEVLDRHCDDCGSPFCPDCGAHTDWCPDCGAYHCPEGCWFGYPDDELSRARREGTAWPVI